MPNVQVLLDSSGSMGFLGTEPVDAVKDFLFEQMQLGEGTATVWTFSNAPTLVVDAQPLGSIAEIPYHCEGLTGLYDGICEMLIRAEEVKEATCLIVTDGHENASTTHSQDDARRLVDDRRASGWTFVYIGAGSCVDRVCEDLGIIHRLTFDPESRSGSLSEVVRTASDFIVEGSTGVLRGNTPRGIQLPEYSSLAFRRQPTHRSLFRGKEDEDDCVLC
jgi:hypothetical protein